MNLIDIVCFLTILATSVQIYLWAVGFSQRIIHEELRTTLPDCTLLICAHNELGNLQANLPIILEKTNLPVLLVNHGSDDGSAEYLSSLAEKNSRLQVSYCRRTKKSKKEALLHGLSLIRTEMVLLTDADCSPLTQYWAESMTAATADNDVCIGLSPLQHGHGLISGFAAWDSVHTALSMAYRARIGKPYMAVGRNLMARKKVLFTTLLQDKTQLLGGDDDLMIQRIRKGHSISVCTDPRSMTLSKAPTSLKSLLKQRRRHISTARYYSNEDKAYLCIVSTSHWVHYAGLWGMILVGQFALAIMLWIARMAVIQWVCQRTVVPPIGWRLLVKVPLLDVGYLLFYPIITVLMQLKLRKEW